MNRRLNLVADSEYDQSMNSPETMNPIPDQEDSLHEVDPDLTESVRREKAEREAMEEVEQLHRALDAMFNQHAPVTPLLSDQLQRYTMHVSSERFDRKQYEDLLHRIETNKDEVVEEVADRIYKAWMKTL